MANRKKTYEKGDGAVLWQPAKCIHSEICVKGLPKVFNPDKRPWINVDNASAEEIREQVKECPSGALSWLKDGKEEQNDNSKNVDDMAKIEIIKDGPMKVDGTVAITKSGNEEKKEGPVFLCRCGASSNKPYCDGSHKKAEFRD